MTKAELVARVAAQIQLPQKQTDVLLAVFLTSIIEALRRGEHVELRGFGPCCFGEAVRGEALYVA